MPDEKDQEATRCVNLREKNGLINVYTDVAEVQENLSHERYRIVDEIAQADIIFVRKHYKDYKYGFFVNKELDLENKQTILDLNWVRSLREKFPDVLINQFPFEKVVTVKDLLAVVCRRVPDSTSWLPVTYNLTHELTSFISYFRKRQEENLDNHWILKPWNLARSIDMAITDNLNQIIRFQETGPKVTH